MSIVEEVIKIIQNRYDSPEYRKGIDSITVPEQKIYGEMDKKHSSAVLFWVKKLWPNTPDALMIAAAGHDRDRAFEEERDKLEDYPYISGRPIPDWYDVHKAMHSANTARIIKRELSKILTSEMKIDIVYLILHHEVGGKKDANGDLIYLPDRTTNSYNLNEAADILQKADSLAFFNVLDIYVEWRDPKKVEQKIKYMFERIKDSSIHETIKHLKFNNPRASEIFERVITAYDESAISENAG